MHPSKKPGVRQAYLRQPRRQKGQINTISSALLNTEGQATNRMPTMHRGTRVQAAAQGLLSTGVGLWPPYSVQFYQHGEAGQVSTTCYSRCSMVLDTGEPQQCQQFIIHVHCLYTEAGIRRSTLHRVHHRLKEKQNPRTPER